MKKLLFLFLFCITLTSVKASFIDQIKDVIANNKGDATEKVRDEIKSKLNEYCFKIPFTEYYLCPPINPDKVL